MKLKLLTQPVMPVTLDEAKSYYRVIGNEQDADIERTIMAAVEKAEQITNLQLSKATYEGYIGGFESKVKLPKPPLVSVQKVEYVDADGVRKQYTDYRVDDISLPSVIHFGDMPVDMSMEEIYPIIVTFECGYEKIPSAIASWILIYGLTMFENRENIVVGTIVSDEPKRYHDHLLDSFRIIP